MIFLDMDGVIANIEKSISAIYNEEIDYSNWPKEFYGESLLSVLGSTQEELWSKIDDAGLDFWITIEAYSWFDELVSLCEKHDDDFHILSSPSRKGDSASGKTAWLQDKFGWDFRRYILCPSNSKYLLCSSKKDVLIDDKPSTIKAWRERGGLGILFPQPWNLKNYSDIDRINYISNIFTFIKNGD